MNSEDLATQWIAEMRSLPRDSTPSSDQVEVGGKVVLLALRSPVDCWNLILEVIAATDDPWILSNLAAGPLESLLAHHPSEAFELIENEIPTNPKLKSTLDGVWKNLISDDVWERLRVLARR